MRALSVKSGCVAQLVRKKFMAECDRAGSGVSRGCVVSHQAPQHFARHAHVLKERAEVVRRPLDARLHAGRAQKVSDGRFLLHPARGPQNEAVVEVEVEALGHASPPTDINGMTVSTLIRPTGTPAVWK